MNVEWIVPAALGGVAALAVGLSLLWVGLRRARRATEQAQAETTALRAHLEALERRLEQPATEPSMTEPPMTEYVITHLGAATESSSGGPPVAHVDRTLFADLVLRETVVKTASLAYGLRTALSPASRNRIRFEMRQEVRRNRKQRRAEARTARREWEARQRAALADEDAA